MRPSLSSLRWFFTGRDKKEEANRSYKTLQSLILSDYPSTVERMHLNCLSLQPSLEQYSWSDYLERKEKYAKAVDDLNIYSSKKDTSLEEFEVLNNRLLQYYISNKKAFFSDVLYFEDYLIDREKLDKEFPVIKKDITASGRQFDVAEKMSDYPDIDLFFMIMRLRLLYVSGQGYTRMKLRTLLKHYGYKRRSAAITKHIQDCLMFYHIQTCLRGGQECDVKEISLDDMITFRIIQG